ncbi:MAG: diadenylate cyclase CdaA [Acidobacteria bacterium]|nr:diadenylate cyclase CdaA [Acidobacteriota bacterium]MCB9378811.1 TIGR00159 family protein [Holophagales bacterium]
MSLRELLDLLTWHDFVDIAVVAILFYNLLLLIRGTRAVQMVTGMFLVAGAYYLAQLGKLVTLETIIEKFLIFLPFAVIVLFQHEIRRALANFGRGPFLGRAGKQSLEAAQADVVLAATALASRRFGALIVFERREGLRNYAEAGIQIDALLSYDLLLNIFTPDTPLHDGAVIIQGERIAAAACFLPLSTDSELSKEAGSRHRAALGISEETDAVSLVVSEETGRLSLAIDGRLEPVADGKALRARLHQLLSTESEPAPPKEAAE